MKFLIGAIAFAFAVPAAALTAPAQTNHSQHQQSSAQAQSTHSGHSDHQMPQRGSHDGHAMKEGCCADKDGNGTMDCCEKMAAKKEEQPSASRAGSKPLY